MPNIIMQFVTLYAKTNQYKENMECMGHYEDVSDAIEATNTSTTPEN
jgi:hypothetical protein